MSLRFSKKGPLGGGPFTEFATIREYARLFIMGVQDANHPLKKANAPQKFVYLYRSLEKMCFHVLHTRIFEKIRVFLRKIRV